jgi:hypothetical protein
MAALGAEPAWPSVASVSVAFTSAIRGENVPPGGRQEIPAYGARVLGKILRQAIHQLLQRSTPRPFEALQQKPLPAELIVSHGALDGALGLKRDPNISANTRIVESGNGNDSAFSLPVPVSGVRTSLLEPPPRTNFPSFPCSARKRLSRRLCLPRKRTESIFNISPGSGTPLSQARLTAATVLKLSSTTRVVTHSVRSLTTLVGHRIDALQVRHLAGLSGQRYTNWL